MSAKRVRELLGCSCDDETCRDCAEDLKDILARVIHLHRPTRELHSDMDLCEECVRVAEVPRSAKWSILVRYQYPCATVSVITATPVQDPSTIEV